jgi:hypothetical protein
MATASGIRGGLIVEAAGKYSDLIRQYLIDQPMRLIDAPDQ